MALSTLFCDACGAANRPRASFCRICGSPLQSASAPSHDTVTGRLLPNYLLKQRYRILDSAGSGGMGAVYRAEDTQLGNRQVALKEMSQSGMSPQEQKEAVDAFKQEAVILAQLQHPNLPSILEHFEEKGRWYLVMSFIQGETMEDYLKHARGGKLPLEEVLQIGIQLCTALTYLHTQKPPIIFRDLKPANIMRTSDGHIYLIDFGIARHFKPGQAKDTTYYGAVGYAPPEQYGKAQTTPRSDIYSLGATLYQLASGHDPSSSPFRFPMLPSLVPTAPTGLTTLLTQMLELDEGKRPASMLLVKLELQSVALGSAYYHPSLLTPTLGEASEPEIKIIEGEVVSEQPQPPQQSSKEIISVPVSPTPPTIRDDQKSSTAYPPPKKKGSFWDTLGQVIDLGIAAAEAYQQAKLNGRPSIRDIIPTESLLRAAHGRPPSIFGANDDNAALGKALGIKSERTVQRAFSASYQDVVLNVFLALANTGRPVLAIGDTWSGSFIKAEEPGSMTAYTASLLFEINETGTTNIVVSGKFLVEGQLYDWGKGQRVLNQILSETARHL